MHIENIKDEGSAKHYSITISAAEIQSKINVSTENLVKNYKMPGFRAGKVPMHFIAQKHGSAIRNEVVENTVKDAIAKIVEEHKFELATNPTINNLTNEADKDLTFTLQFEVLPEIIMPNFKDITLEKLVVEVSEQDIEQKLTKLAESYKKFEKAPNNYKAKKGDQLLIDFEGFIDSNAFAGGKAQDHELELGSNSFIEGFEDQLLKSKNGEQKTVKVTFPAKYSSAEVAGKAAEFIVKVKEVRTAIIPKIDEEFLKTIDMADMTALKTKLADQIKAEYAEDLNPIMKIKLFDQLENKLNFAIPESLVKKEFDALWQQLQSIKDSDSTIAEKSEQELREYYNKIAARRVKIGLMLAEYAKLKGIKVTNEDLNQVVMKQVQLYPNSYKEIFNYYKNNPQAVNSLKGPIIEDKTVDSIINNEINLILRNHDIATLNKIIEEENNKEVL